MDISTFKNMTSKLPVAGTLEEVASAIRSDERLKALTASYRQTGSKAFKLECPLFAVACRFEGGKAQGNATSLTGLSLVDFDHVENEERRVKNEEWSIENEERSIKNEERSIENEERRVKNEESYSLQELREKAMADPHTLMCYTTVSGNGLRIIFRYELPKDNSTLLTPNSTLLTPNSTLLTPNSTLYYRQAFFAGNAYYERLLGIKADRQCKNVTRLSGLAHDPDVFLRAEAEAVAFSMEEIANAADDQARSNREEKQTLRIQTYYDTLIAPQLERDGIRYVPGSHNEYVMRVGYRLAERRFPKKVALKWAKSLFADYEDTEQVVSSCYANARPREGKGNGGEGKGCATVDEIKAFLDCHAKLRFNEITGRVECLDEGRWMPVNDRRVNSLWAEMSGVTKVFKQDIYSIIESDYVPNFNPFREYFESLPPSRQPTGAILELARTIRVRGDDTEQDLWYRYLQKWLVAMVASWLSEETVNNVILVLIGEQGAFKTTWFNYLLPPKLKRYFYTKTNANRMSKDDLLTLAQYALVCCEELDTMRPSELNQLKAVVTMPSIDERAAYAHFHEHRKHIASFCATGNNPQFLTDPTGNRRWLPFEVERIVSPRERPFDYDAIYAEAYALYKGGFKYWFEKDEIRELNKHNEQFETPRLERELVDLYFRKPGPEEMGEFMSVARALQTISLGISQKLNAMNVGKAFTELGFKRVRTNRCRGFIVICRTAEEIRAYQRLLSHDAKPDTPDDTRGGTPA